MGLVDHAKRELQAAGLFDKDSAYDGMLAESVMELVEVFAKQGHSGMSAPMCIRLFERVAMFEPLGPLTGAPEEWNEVGPGIYQNNRCSHVFKENGEAYDSEGRIFREPDGSCYQSIESRVPVTFPYTPKREYVDVTPGASGREG